MINSANKFIDNVDKNMIKIKIQRFIRELFLHRATRDPWRNDGIVMED